MFRVMRCEPDLTVCHRQLVAEFKTYEEADEYAMDLMSGNPLDVWYEIDEE